MTESLMTDTAATTTEGTDASQGQPTTPSTEGVQANQQQQTTEGQNQTDAKPGAEPGNTDSNQDGKPTGAPEKYEFTAEQGKEFDPEVLTAFSEVAKELNLPQDAAQKLLDKMAPTIVARQMEQLDVVRNEWSQASQSDKEFGGDKLQENLAVAKKALDSFGTPELRSLLNESGLGNNPEVIRFMFRAGKAISEDRFVAATTGANPKSAPKGFNDLASALYSNQQS
jgi:hypothetical protein